MSTSLLIVVAVGYSLVQKRLSNWDTVNLAAANIWDGVVPVVFDPYILIYFLFPFVLISAARDSSRLTSNLVLIRAGSYWRWVVVAGRHAVVRVGQVGLAMAAAVLATLPGFSLASGWSDLARQSGPMSPLAALVQLNLPPVVIVTFELGMVAAMLTGSQLIVHLTALFLAGSAPYLGAAGLWVLTVTDLRVRFPPPLGLATAMQLVPATAVTGSLAAAAALALAPVGAAIVAVGLITMGRHTRPRPRSWIFAAYAALSVAVIAVAVTAAATDSSSAAEALLVALDGSTPAGTQIGHYLLMVIIFVGWAYIFGVALENEMHGRLELHAIRAGTLWRLWLKIVTPWWLASAVVPVGTILVAALVSGLPLSVQPGTGLPSLELISYHWLINGTLQLWVYLTVVFLARWFVPGPAAVLLAIGSFTAAGLPVFQSFGFPIANNSLGYTLYGSSAVFAVSVRLALVLTGTVIITAVAFRLRRSLPIERL